MTGENESDVNTYSDRVEYDLSAVEYAGDRFMTFASYPIRFNNADLNPNRDYKISGSKIYIPADKQGVYEVEYMVKPDAVTADNVDQELSIDPQLHDLVALKAAYYIYSVTDADIAVSCNAEYQRQLGIALAKIRRARTPIKFRDLRGW
jgi:hypothetical protein